MNARRFTTHRRIQCRFDPGGFTLIELLIVVGIIALLISLLLPSLKKAREQARVTVCMANLKRVGTASLTYATEDPHEQPIPVHPSFDRAIDLGANDWGGKSGIDDSPTQDPLESPHGTAMGFGPATRPLNAVSYKAPFTDYQNDPGPDQVNWKQDAALDLPGHRCPSDRGYAGHHYLSWRNSKLSSYDHYGTSYFANALLGNTSHDVANVSIYLLPLSRVPAPGVTVHYLENCGRFAWHVNYGTPDEPVEGCHPMSGPGQWRRATGPRFIKGWHRRAFRFSTAFCDGHVEQVHIQGRTESDPWQLYEDGGHYTFTCNVIRGAGWRMDPKPARPRNLFYPTVNPQRAKLKSGWGIID